MDKHMVLDDKTKNRMGIICFIPVLCFLAAFIYWLAMVLPLTQGHQVPSSIVGLTSRNYDIFFFILAAAAIITAPVFIYCLVLLARMKHLNEAHKLMWIIFLSVMAPIASALFWLFLIREAPERVGIYPDIA